MKRAILLTLIAASACGPGPADKDKNNTFFNNQSNNGPNNTATNNTATNNTSTNNVATNNTSTNNVATNNTSTNNTATNNTSTNNANNTTTNNANNTTTNNANNTMGPCIDTAFYGQIGGMEEHDGGVVTTAAPTVDANLSSILSSVPIAPDDPMTVEDEGYRVLNAPISVSSALVTATGFGAAGNARFFLQDSNATVQVFLPVGVAETVRVGMQVSFDATALQNFEGHPQISELTNFVVDSVDNPVPLREANNRALQPNDYLHVVQIGGVLGTPYDCGGTNCYPLTYPGGEVVFRSKTEFVEPGDCVTFTGPVYSFPGPLQGDMTPVLQLDTINFGWYWRRVDP